MELHEKAIAMITEVTADAAAPRLTQKEIRTKVGRMSETNFRSFLVGTHPNKRSIKNTTLTKHAERIISAINALLLEKSPSPLAYTAIKTLLETSEPAIQNWLHQHRGAYLYYRFASSGGLIQVSGLQIFETSGRAQFRQIFKIAKPKFGEGRERSHEGDVHPVKNCAHLIFAGKDQMHHCILSQLQGTTSKHMVGIVAGLSTDGSSVFGSRLMAIKYSENPEADVSAARGNLGIDFSNTEEEEFAHTLNVVSGTKLPTIAVLLSAEDKPGSLHATIPDRRDHLE
jgi:hypothetical protein